MINEVEDIEVTKEEAKDIIDTMLRLVEANEQSISSDETREADFTKMANYVKNKMHDERDIPTIIQEIKDIFITVLTRRLKS